MNPRFRNVICPWQTKRELKMQDRFLRMMEKSLVRKGWTQQQLDELMGLDKPDRTWTR